MNAQMKPMEQGSPEWHEHRAKYRNASETPAVMGVSPYVQSQKQLARLKRGIKSVKENWAMQRGHDVEPLIREQMEAEMDDAFEPSVLVNGNYSASLDGINATGETILEIKLKSAELLNCLAEGRPRYDHWLQIQHQLMVSGADVCLYCIGDGKQPPEWMSVYPDDAAWQAIREAWGGFWPLMDAPSEGLQEVAERYDNEWFEAVSEWRLAKEQLAKAEKAEKAAKQKLIEMADGQTTSGHGVRAILTERKGSVDYSKIPELKGVDLDQYRKKPSQYWQIREERQEGNHAD